MGRATLSFNQKEAKKLRKRARYAESRFRDTSDKRWLTKRDTYNDKAAKLLQDLVNNVENQKKHQKMPRVNRWKVLDEEDEEEEECVCLA